MGSSIGVWLCVIHYSDPHPPEPRLSAGSNSLPKSKTPNPCPIHSLSIFPLTTKMSVRPLLLCPLGSSYLFIILWEAFLDHSFSPQNSTPHFPIMKLSAPGLIKSSRAHLFWRSRSYLKISSSGWPAAVMFEQSCPALILCPEAHIMMWDGDVLPFTPEPTSWVLISSSPCPGETMISRAKGSSSLPCICPTWPAH